jgi:transcriptional regulator with XRE-family HTH domain
VDDVRTGRRIRAIRHRRRWRQQDLADEAGTSQDMVSRLERGRIAAMTIGSLRGIAQALDAEVPLVDGAEVSLTG